MRRGTMRAEYNSFCCVTMAKLGLFVPRLRRRKSCTQTDEMVWYTKAYHKRHGTSSEGHQRAVRLLQRVQESIRAAEIDHAVRHQR
jgi:hypothetical protein